MKKVKVIFPDGSTAEIDRADLKSALAAGAKLFSGEETKSTKVKFPDGSETDVDENDLQSAIDAGATVLKKKETSSQGLSQTAATVGAVPKSKSPNQQFGTLGAQVGSITQPAAPVSEPDSFTENVITGGNPYTGDKMISNVKNMLSATPEQIERTDRLASKEREDYLTELSTKLYYGEATADDLKDLSQKPYGKEILPALLERFAPGSVIDGETFREYDLEQAAANIKKANRTNGVARKESEIQFVDQEIKNTLSQTKGIGRALGSTFEVPGSEIIAGLDLNDKASLSKAIGMVESYIAVAPSLNDYKKATIMGSIPTKEGLKFVERKQELLNYLRYRLHYNISKSGGDPEIEALQPSIRQAIRVNNIAREIGEPETEAGDANVVHISEGQQGPDRLQETSNRWDLNEEHFKAGLEYMKYYNRAKYDNVVRSIKDGGQVSDGDFRTLSSIGQDIVNSKKYIASASNPDLIDKETNFDYTTREDKKSQYAVQIGEYLKSQGFKNIREFTGDQIRSAARNLGLKNPEVIEDLVHEEKIFGYDAIPKGGGTEAFARGVIRPFVSIKQTMDNIFIKSPSEVYLDSQKTDRGVGQLVQGKDGKMDVELPSDRGNVWYDALEGFGQFIPQVILSKGIGAALKLPAAAMTPTATLTASQAARVTNYGGTFVSTFLQEYGSNYEDALNKTGDVGTARLMGSLNGIAASAFELFLPDAKIADRAAGIFKSEAAQSLIDVIKKGGNLDQLVAKGTGVVRKFVTSTLNTAAQEVSEEVATQITNYIVESVFSPKTVTDRDLMDEILETAKATAVSMSIPSILGGGGAASQKSFTVSAFNAAAININEYKRSLDAVLAKKEISQEEYDKAMRMLQTHRESIYSAPEMDANNRPLTSAQKFNYAFAETQVKINKARAEQSQGVQKEMYEKKVEALQNQQRDILFKGQPAVEDQPIQPVGTEVAGAGQPGAAAGQQAVTLTAEEQSVIDAVKKNEALAQLDPTNMGRMAFDAANSNDPATQKEAIQMLVDQATNPATLSGIVGDEVVDAVTSLPQKSTLDTAAKIREAQREVRSYENRITVSDMIDVPATFKGQKGRLVQEEDGMVVFKVEGQNREYELGKKEVIGATSIKDFEMEQENTVVGSNDAGNILVRGKEYVNNFSDPTAAINRDEDGNVVSINLETVDGKKRTFRGDIAEDVAYQISLKQITQDNETATQFEDFINTDEAARTEINNAAVSASTQTQAVGDNTQIQREAITAKPRVRVTAAQMEGGQPRNMQNQGDQDVDVFDHQDADAERIISDKGRWKGEGGNVWRYKFENAGDVLRELAKYKNTFLDPGYIYEKINAIESFIKKFREDDVHPVDKYSTLKNVNAEPLSDLRRAYEEQPTVTEAQEVARQLALNLIDGNLDEAQKQIDYFNALRDGDTKANLMRVNAYPDDNKTKTSSNAIQKQEPAEGVLRDQRVRRESQLPEVEQGDKSEESTQPKNQKRKVGKSGSLTMDRQTVDTIEVDPDDNSTRAKVISDVKKVVKALEGLIPNIKVVVLDTDQGFKEVTKSAGRGAWSEKTKTMYLNVAAISRAKRKNTAYHEGVHPIMNALSAANPGLVESLVAQIESLVDDLPGVNAVLDYANQQPTGTRDMEAVVEFISQVANGDVVLPPDNTPQGRSLLSKIAKIINDFLSLIGSNKTVKPNSANILQLSRQISDMFNKGQDVRSVIDQALSNVDGIQSQGLYRVTGKEKISNGTALPTNHTAEIGADANDSLSAIRDRGKRISSPYLSRAIDFANGSVKGPDSLPNDIVLPYANKALARTLTRLRDNFKSIKGSSKADNDRKDKILDRMLAVSDQVYSEFKNTIKENIRSVYKTYDGKLAERSRKWYEGANRLAQNMAQVFDVSLEAASGIIASLSPQNAWFNNVSGAYRVLNIMKNHADDAITNDMIKSASKESFGTPFSHVINKAKKDLIGKSLNDLMTGEVDINDVATALRIMDLSIHHRLVPIVSPEGEMTGMSDSRFAWGSNAEIAKAILIFRDQSLPNISKRLGRGNKVRNFYNNIASPNSKNGEVTIDTHAIGAAFMNIMSSKDAASMGLFTVGTYGDSVMYSLLKESYAEVATEEGLLPREMQSITWEAIRLMFDDSTKKAVGNRDFINSTWDDKNKQKIDYGKAVSSILGRFNIGRPDWARSTNKRIDRKVLQEVGSTLYKGERDGDNLRGQPERSTGEDTTRVVEGDGGWRPIESDIQFQAEERASEVLAAPFYDTNIGSVRDAEMIISSPAYRNHVRNIKAVSDRLGLNVTDIRPAIGGFLNEDGNRIIEVSNIVSLSESDLDKVEELAALMGVMSPETQESTIASKYLSKGDTERHNANEYAIKVNDVDAAVDALRKAGLDNFTVDYKEKEVRLLDIFDYPDPDFIKKLSKFAKTAKANGIKSERVRRRPVESRYIDSGSRENIIGRIRSDGGRLQQGGDQLRAIIAKATEANEIFRREQELKPTRKKYAALRSKQIDLQDMGQDLSPEELTEMHSYAEQLVPVVADVISSRKEAYEEAKAEIEEVGKRAVGRKGFVLPFQIKKLNRATVKTVEWYGANPNRLGDGARTNLVVYDVKNADSIFNKIKSEYPGAVLREEREITDLGFPKRLLEVRTSNGRIAEFQVVSIPTYVAKDGVDLFTEDTKDLARQALADVSESVGQEIPDGVGHWLYEVNRDVNVQKSLRDEAKRLSILYYDAFNNPESFIEADVDLNEEIADFAADVVSADKSKWAADHSERAPVSIQMQNEDPKDVVEAIKNGQVKYDEAIEGKDQAFVDAINTGLFGSKKFNFDAEAFRTSMRRQRDFGMSREEVIAGLKTIKNPTRRQMEIVDDVFFERAEDDAAAAELQEAMKSISRGQRPKSVMKRLSVSSVSQIVRNLKDHIEYTVVSNKQLEDIADWIVQTIDLDQAPQYLSYMQENNLSDVKQLVRAKLIVEYQNNNRAAEASDMILTMAEEAVNAGRQTQSLKRAYEILNAKGSPEVRTQFARMFAEKVRQRALKVNQRMAQVISDKEAEISKLNSKIHQMAQRSPLFSGLKNVIDRLCNIRRKK